jgi:hypothetical protein
MGHIPILITIGKESLFAFVHKFLFQRQVKPNLLSVCKSEEKGDQSKDVEKTGTHILCPTHIFSKSYRTSHMQQ